MKKNIVLLLYILLVIFLLVASFTPGDVSSKQSSVISDMIENIISSVNIKINKENLNIGVRKIIGHYGAFFMLGILTFFNYRFYIFNKKILYSIYVLSGMLIAFITEIIQLFVSGRSGNFVDCLIDIFGYACGLILTFLFVKIKKRLNEGKIIEQEEEL